MCSWISAGDTSSQFFNATIQSRKASNKICQINTMDGKLTEDCPEILDDGIKYFKTQGGLTAPEHLPPSETSLLMSESASKTLISVEKKSRLLSSMPAQIKPLGQTATQPFFFLHFGPSSRWMS
eukprot:TRINITY_DN2931_c0_g1_i6.p2 TRINITY_DN2931_c0_g1~~TRINITY_DN2931_c0_g1_i6.p2  ORF type:complete len:124 (-),score=16.93 TRINITY_DN2931_c0_g1_i6:2915-3286(-)